ncbi:MAG: hypothetical protein QNJ16_05180 [Rhodobacter sp.]|nr:hypothetical protein [Rhodobacter sp.]
MRTRQLISALLIGLLAQAAAARTEVPACVAEVAPGLFHLDVYDLGAGITAYLENSEARGSRLWVTSCFTGNYAGATVWAPRGKGRRDYPAALEVFEDAALPDTQVVLTQLIERWQARGVPVAAGVSRVETCACAARYPGLRGTKEAFETP